MIIEKCISMLLASIIFVDSGAMWLPAKYEPVQIEPQVIISTEIIEEPAIEVEQIVEEPIEIVEEIEPVVEEIPKPAEPIRPVETVIETQPITNSTTLSDSDIDLIALVTMAEAEGESELGKRLVIDVILNRYDSTRFPNTINGVVYARNAFECMTNGRVNRCHVREDIRQLVVEELTSRTNSNIHYFRTNHYHGFGKPVLSEGNHYFSTY
jgi:N-acetylmuramoyl-L-alanine amidase